jgi:hypothetical protein
VAVEKSATVEQEQVEAPAAAPVGKAVIETDDEVLE